MYSHYPTNWWEMYRERELYPYKIIYDRNSCYLPTVINCLDNIPPIGGVRFTVLLGRF